MVTSPMPPGLSRGSHHCGTHCGPCKIPVSAPARPQTDKGRQTQSVLPDPPGLRRSGDPRFSHVQTLFHPLAPTYLRTFGSRSIFSLSCIFVEGPEVGGHKSSI